MLRKHRESDAVGAEPELKQREKRHIERLRREACQLEQWLEQHREERKSAKGKARLSNRTDNESAKMATGKGVVQGYTGVAAVDDKHQLVVHATAHGSGSEQEVLPGMLDGLAQLRAPDTIIAADSGYYSEANVQQLESREIEGYIPDPNYRKRDPRYEGQGSTGPSPMRCGNRKHCHEFGRMNSMLGLNHNDLVDKRRPQALVTPFTQKTACP